jgi:G3E family GTPase
MDIECNDKLIQTKVDVSELSKIDKFKWKAQKLKGRSDIYANWKNTRIYLARYLMNLHLTKCSLSTLSITANHVDQNTLNNQLLNLEAKTNTQNVQLNSKLKLGRFIKRSGKGYYARISHRGKSLNSKTWHGDQHNAAISSAIAKWRDALTTAEFKELTADEIKAKLNNIITHTKLKLTKPA